MSLYISHLLENDDKTVKSVVVCETSDRDMITHSDVVRAVRRHYPDVLDDYNGWVTHQFMCCRIFGETPLNIYPAFQSCKVTTLNNLYIDDVQRGAYYYQLTLRESDGTVFRVGVRAHLIEFANNSDQPGRRLRSGDVLFTYVPHFRGTEGLRFNTHPAYYVKFFHRSW